MGLKRSFERKDLEYTVRAVAFWIFNAVLQVKPLSARIVFFPLIRDCKQFVRPDFDSAAFVRSSVRNDSVSDDLVHLRQVLFSYELS